MRIINFYNVHTYPHAYLPIHTSLYAQTQTERNTYMHTCSNTCRYNNCFFFINIYASFFAPVMEAIYLHHILVFHFFIYAIHFSEAITWWYCIFVCVCVTILPANSKMQSDWGSTWCLSLTILNNEIEGHVFNLSELGSKNISLNSLQYFLFVEQRGKNRMSFVSIFKLYFLLSFSCKSIFVKK